MFFVDRNMKRSYLSGYEKLKRKKAKEVESLKGVRSLTDMGFGKLAKNSTDMETSQLPISNNEPTTSSSSDLSCQLTESENVTISKSIATSNDVAFNDDPATWKTSQTVIDFFVQKGYVPQNMIFSDVDLIKSKLVNNRSITKPMFVRKMRNGEEVQRNWLSFSRSTKKVYCSFCTLFGLRSILEQNNFVEGFNDWKNASE